MNQFSRVPEYTVEESGKIRLTGKQLGSFVQDLLVDTVVLHKEFTKLEGFSGRIVDDIRALELYLSGMEHRD